MNCKHCGQIIEETVSFCPHCGKPVKEEPVAEQTHTYESVPTPEVTPVPTAPAVQQKSKLVAGLLGIFLGCYGAHNFYLGFTKKAVIQLVVCLAGFCLVVGPLVAGIWGLVEGIMILAGNISEDANGVPLKD